MNARALATNAVWALASHVLHRGSLMLGAILLARSLPTGDFAAYSYFQMTVAMLTTYAAMGLGVTASRFFAEYGHQRDGAAAPLGTLLALSFGLAAVAFLVILLLPGAWRIVPMRWSSRMRGTGDIGSRCARSSMSANEASSTPTCSTWARKSGSPRAPRK